MSDTQDGRLLRWGLEGSEGLQPAAIDNSDMHDPRSQMQDADNRLRPDMSQRRRLPLTPAAMYMRLGQ